MGLDDVTPVLLTYNEERNIGRTLRALAWAKDVVVLDSGSQDRTRSIATAFPNVRWHERSFDNHGAQWRHALMGTAISSSFVLALDADMIVTDAFVEELEKTFLAGDYDGGLVPLEYWAIGRPLHGSICPAQVRVLKLTSADITQPGHSQAFAVRGRVYEFRAPVRHDDRKSVEHWVQSQLRYSRLEQDRLRRGERLRVQDRLRRMGIMPVIAGAYAYFRSGGPLTGKPALRYAWERVVFECLLAMRVLEEDVAED
jgi:glycosyltransferase involved in cell wall biosynthesis